MNDYKLTVLVSDEQVNAALRKLGYKQSGVNRQKFIKTLRDVAEAAIQVDLDDPTNCVYEAMDYQKE